MAYLMWCSDIRKKVKQHIDSPGPETQSLVSMMEQMGIPMSGNISNQQLKSMWNALPESDKQKWQDYAKQTKAERGTDRKKKPKVDVEDAEAGDEESEQSVFPVARLKKLLKVDDDISSLAKEAIAVVGKASELFLKQLAYDCAKTATKHGKKTISAEFFDETARSNSQYEFLRDTYRAADIPTSALPPPKKPAPKRKSTGSASAVSPASPSSSSSSSSSADASDEPPLKASKKLTDFFATTSSSPAPAELYE